MNRNLLLWPPFLAAVVLLAVNDHLLKPAFGNAVTGKLSDVAGLFAATVFAAALAPRWRLASAAGIALAFAWWKSPASADAIEIWNSLGLWTVGRTVDASDLLALPAVALAVACRHRHRAPEVPRRALLSGAVGVLSLVAFMATSYRSAVAYSAIYSYPGTVDEAVQALEANGITVYGGPETGKIELGVPSDFCFKSLYAAVTLQPAGASTQLRLREITHQCPRRDEEEQVLLEIFEAQVAEPLKMRRVE